MRKKKSHQIVMLDSDSPPSLSSSSSPDSSRKSFYNTPPYILNKVSSGLADFWNKKTVLERGLFVANGVYALLAASVFAILAGLGVEDDSTYKDDGQALLLFFALYYGLCSLLMNVPMAAEYSHKVYDIYVDVKKKPGRAHKGAAGISVGLGFVTTFVGLGLAVDAIVGLTKNKLSDDILVPILILPFLWNAFSTRTAGSYDMLSGPFEAISDVTRRLLGRKDSVKQKYRNLADDITNHKDIFKKAYSTQRSNLYGNETAVVQEFYRQLAAVKITSGNNARKILTTSAKFTLAATLMTGSVVMMPIFLAKASQGLLSLSELFEFLPSDSATRTLLQYLPSSTPAVFMSAMSNWFLYAKLSLMTRQRIMETWERARERGWSRAAVSGSLVALGFIAYCSGKGFFREAMELSKNDFDNEKGFTEVVGSFLMTFHMLGIFNFARQSQAYAMSTQAYAGLINFLAALGYIGRHYLEPSGADKIINQFIEDLRVKGSHHAEDYDFDFDFDLPLEEVLDQEQSVARLDIDKATVMRSDSNAQANFDNYIRAFSC